MTPVVCTWVPRTRNPSFACLLAQLLAVPLVALSASCNCTPKQDDVGYVAIRVPNHRGSHFTAITGSYRPDPKHKRQATDDRKFRLNERVAISTEGGSQVPNADTPATHPATGCAIQVQNWWLYLTGPNPCGRTTRVQAVGTSTTFIIEESVAEGCDRIYLLWNPGESQPTDSVTITSLGVFSAQLAVLTRASDSTAGERYAKINHTAAGPVLEGIYLVDESGALNRRFFVDFCTP